MKKKLYFCAVALAAMTVASCSQEDSLTPDNGGKVEQVNNTTVLGVSKLNDGAQSRTIVNVSNWQLAWNNGDTKLFTSDNNLNNGVSDLTGFDVNVDRLAFLTCNKEMTVGTGEDATTTTDWSYLLSDNNRQVFKFDSYTNTAHSDDETQPNSNAIFKVSNKMNSTTDYYAGLDANTEYHGYYFLPFVKDKALPIHGDGSDSYATAFQANGYNPEPINIYEWWQNGQSETTLQKYLAEYDFLTAKPHGSTENTIKPSRDGTFNSATNSYDVNIDMVHTMALVEIDVLLTANTANSDTKGKNTKLTTCKIIGKKYNDDKTVISSAKVFDAYAALDSKAAWTYPDARQSYEYRYEYDEEGNLVATNSYQVESGIMCYTTREDTKNTCFSLAPALSTDTWAANLFNRCKENDQDTKTIGDYKILKFFMLVRNTIAPDFYIIQLFSGTNYREVKFEPGAMTSGTAFRFEPGNYYRLVLKADVKNNDSAGWQSNEANNIFRGIYPANTTGKTYWYASTVADNSTVN